MKREGRLSRAALLLIALDLVLGCLTERDAMRGPPQIEVHVPPSTMTCGKRHVDIIEGGVPDDALEIARGSTVGKEPHLSLRAHEEAARERAWSMCADGISVLSATESPNGVSSAVVAFWKHRPENVDAGVVDVPGVRDVRDGGGAQ